jgi:hypothetical protein
LVIVSAKTAPYGAEASAEPIFIESTEQDRTEVDLATASLDR